ncbi:MAG: hypothetical protein ACTHJ3_02125 [Pararhizobium sp.]
MIISPPVSEIYVHVRRDLADAGVPLKAVLEDVNLRIRSRGGIILADRQILRMPIGKEWGVHTFFDEETTTPFEHLKQEWGDAQRRYFTELWGLSDPYQYSEEPVPYDRYCFGAYLPRPFLSGTERALAVIEAKRYDMLYYCQCHSGAVVYTTARRVICMDCGKLHCVLAAPLQSALGRASQNNIGGRFLMSTVFCWTMTLTFPRLNIRTSTLLRRCGRPMYGRT